MSEDSITAYFNEIARVPLLTAQQEIQLSRQIQAAKALEAEGKVKLSRDEQRIMRNGKRAMDRMMTSNLRLVVNVARKYRRICNSLELMDVISLGNLGLATAANKFDPERGYKFSTYAYWWIRQSIWRGVNDQDRAIRVPVHQYEKMAKMRKWHSDNPGRTLQEAAVACGVSMEDIELTRTALSLTSLDQCPVEDGESLAAMVRSEEQSPDEALIERSRLEDLERVMAHLPPIDQKILRLRYGLQGPELTLAEIGKRLGVCRERVRQREKRALNRLRYLSQVGVAA